MKRFLVLVTILLLAATPSVAEIDLSGMSTEELISLRQQIDELLNKQRQQLDELLDEGNTIYSGVYVTGKDIASGKYTFTCNSLIEDYRYMTMLVYTGNETSGDFERYDISLGEELYLNLPEGVAVEISHGTAVIKNVSPNWAL